MAELLRIQPQAVQTAPGVQRVPTMGGEFLGRGLQDLGETLVKLQNGADTAEAARSTTEGAQEFKNIIQKQNDTISDPKEFVQSTNEQIDLARQNRLAAASNGRVRGMIEQGLANDYIAAKGITQHHGFIKTKDQATDNFLETEKTLIRASANATPENKEFFASEYGKLLGSMTANNYLEKAKAKERLFAFNGKVQTNEIMNGIITDPDQTLNDIRDGKYSDVDPTHLTELLKATIEAGKRRDTTLAHNETVYRGGLFRSYLRLADQGKLSMDEINAAEYDGTLEPNQLKELRGRAGTPIQQTSPGTVNSIMTDWQLNRNSGRAIRELQDLLQKAPRDPHVGAAIEHIRNSDKADAASSRAATAHGRVDRNQSYADAIIALDNTPIGDTDFNKKFRQGTGYIGQKRRNQYSEAIKHMEKAIKLDGVDPKKALEDARNEMTRGVQQGDPHAVKLDDMQNDAGK